MAKSVSVVDFPAWRKKKQLNDDEFIIFTVIIIAVVIITSCITDIIDIAASFQ